jgi:acyl-CoA synthetase (AMP-forming)/AMP-acid ligase II
MMNVYDYLFEGKSRDSTALLTLTARYSFGDLEYAAEYIASLLVHSSGKKGDRALLLAESGFFWVAAYLGIMRAGFVCVPLPTKIALSELDYVVSITEPLYAFVDSQMISTLASPLRTTTLITDLQIPYNNGVPPENPGDLQTLYAGEASGFPNAGEDDLAALMFTSGSTGKPRGVMISHRNIVANTESIIQYMGLNSNDRVMAVLPFDYCFGASLLHTHLRVGGSIVVESRFMYPQVILERLSEAECTGFAGVPSHFQILLRRSMLGSLPLPHLRYVQQAGGQLAPIYIAELRKALPGKQIFIMYGQTEATARISYLPPDLLDAKLGSVGKGIPGVRLQVLNDLGLPVKPGESGEIVAEGDNVALGYWRDEAETALSFRDGCLHTGDLATVDSDGFIYILDRAKDFLKCGGKRISCRMVENALLEHPGLIEAAVVGVPDEILGEAAVAFIVPLDSNSPPTFEELLFHCKHRLSAAFVPKQFFSVKALPKNSRGKILKSELKANQPEHMISKSWSTMHQDQSALVSECKD